MDKKDQDKLLALNSEFAQIVTETRGAGVGLPQSNTGGSVALLFDPAELYGRAVAELSSDSPPDSDSVTPANIARSIRMTAAKIMAGDRHYIAESMLGQALWLQTLAFSVNDYATGVEDVRRKIELEHLLLKIQTAATKTLASLATLAYWPRAEP